MSLSLNFKAYQSDDGKSIVFHETTGSATLSTGWGAGTNPAVGDATYVGVRIEALDETIESYDATNTPTTEIDISASFPSDSDVEQYNFDMADMSNWGQGMALSDEDTFPDGIYQLEYKVTATTDYNKASLIFCDFNLRCCIRKMFAAISIANCDCDCVELCRALKVRALWYAIHAAVETGNKTRALSLYEIAYDMCTQITGCGC